MSGQTFEISSPTNKSMVSSSNSMTISCPISNHSESVVVHFQAAPEDDGE
jgi:hypothetical protein